eukprot:768601-Hanusia_phi.AAC.2
MANQSAKKADQRTKDFRSVRSRHYSIMRVLLMAEAPHSYVQHLARRAVCLLQLDLQPPRVGRETG